jgi:phage terminase large subunit GpA-like protein
MKEHLPWETKRWFWVCPECGQVNAFNWDDAERAIRLLKKEVKVCHGSCFDNICGGCGANIVQPDSPILAPCYTHSED